MEKEYQKVSTTSVSVSYVYDGDIYVYPTRTFILDSGPAILKTFMKPSRVMCAPQIVGSDDPLVRHCDERINATLGRISTLTGRKKNEEE